MDLTGVSRTTVWTLYLRAVDARRRRPVLGDPWAGPVLERLDPDVSRLWMLRGDAPAIATRAREIDRWTRDFLDRHPDGQVVSLACGLDSRVLRVAPPAGCRWTDVDLAPVVALRRRLYDLPAGVETVAASIEDDALWDGFGDDRPTLVLAEGLLMYLEPAVVGTFLDRMERRPAPLEVCVDVVGPWVLPLSRLMRIVTGDDVRFRWGTRSAAAMVRGRPGLRVVDDVALAPLVAREAVPGPLGRALAASTRLSPVGSAMRVLRLAGTAQAQS